MFAAIEKWLAEEANAANPFYDLVKTIFGIMNFIAAL